MSSYDVNFCKKKGNSLHIPDPLSITIAFVIAFFLVNL